MDRSEARIQIMMIERRIAEMKSRITVLEQRGRDMTENLRLRKKNTNKTDGDNKLQNALNFVKIRTQLRWKRIRQNLALV